MKEVQLSTSGFLDFKKLEKLLIAEFQNKAGEQIKGFNIFVNIYQEIDQYGNIGNITAKLKEPNENGKVTAYIANLKPIAQSTPPPTTPTPTAKTDGLPF